MAPDAKLLCSGLFFDVLPVLTKPALAVFRVDPRKSGGKHLFVYVDLAHPDHGHQAAIAVCASYIHVNNFPGNKTGQVFFGAASEILFGFRGIDAIEPDLGLRLAFGPDGDGIAVGHAHAAGLPCAAGSADQEGQTEQKNSAHGGPIRTKAGVRQLWSLRSGTKHDRSPKGEDAHHVEIRFLHRL